MEPIHGRGFGSVRIRSVSESMTNRLLNVVLAAVLLVIHRAVAAARQPRPVL